MTQTKPQRKEPGVCRSPRSGAIPKNPKKWKPGESGNPAGSTTRKRMQAAFDEVIESVDVRVGVEAAWRVACDDSNPLHLQALKWLFDRGVGPVTESAATKVEIVTVLRFEERKGDDVELAPQRITAATAARLLEAPAEEVEIDVE